MRLVFKNLPLAIHPKSPDAHRAAEAAHRQGKFWPMHDRIFANQGSMDVETYRRYARELELDLKRFERDMASPEVQAAIDRDKQEAAQLKVRGTPGFFINGRFLSGAQPLEAFKAIIDSELERS